MKFKSFAAIAKEFAETLGYAADKLKTVVLTANNENGAQAKECGTVDFSMNAREIYRVFRRSGVELSVMPPSDAMKFAIDPDCVFGHVTGPVAFNYDAEPETLKIDGKLIAIAHNLGQSAKLLEEVRQGISRFDVIRLCA